MSPMQLVNEPGRLIVRSSSSDWELISFLAIIVGVMAGFDPNRAAPSLVTGAGLVLACLWCARPHEIVALFELRDRKVTYVRRDGYCVRERTESYSFTDIVSLSAQERRDRLYHDYLPVITLRDGHSFPISVAHGSANEVGRLIETLCDALGLPRVDK